MHSFSVTVIIDVSKGVLMCFMPVL